MVEIIKKKFDQDLFLNLWCNPLGYFAKMNSTLGSVVPLAMFTYSPQINTSNMAIQKEEKNSQYLSLLLMFLLFVVISFFYMKTTTMAGIL